MNESSKNTENTILIGQNLTTTLSRTTGYPRPLNGFLWLPYVAIFVVMCLLLLASFCRHRRAHRLRWLEMQAHLEARQRSRRQSCGKIVVSQNKSCQSTRHMSDGAVSSVKRSRPHLVQMSTLTDDYRPTKATIYGRNARSQMVTSKGTSFGGIGERKLALSPFFCQLVRIKAQNSGTGGAN